MLRLPFIQFLCVSGDERVVDEDSSSAGRRVYGCNYAMAAKQSKQYFVPMSRPRGPEKESKKEHIGVSRGTAPERN
jgi:hypothetical protein